MHNNYSESTRRFRNLGRIEDFWDQQGKVIHEERGCCDYCSNKYVMACWDNHKERMLACLKVLLMMLLHMEGSN
jgi:hypothetical protein